MCWLLSKSDECSNRWIFCLYKICAQSNLKLFTKMRRIKSTPLVWIRAYCEEKVTIIFMRSKTN